MPLYRDTRLLNDFREMPYFIDSTKPRKSGGKVMRADSLTDAILERLSAKMAYVSTLETISENWSMCVDAKLANKSFVYNVLGEIVFVSTINAQVKQAIVFNQTKILAKIRQLQGCENITKIRFQ